MALLRGIPFLLILALCGGPASPAGAKPRGDESFTGACDMSGTVAHDPPLTGVPQPTKIRGDFRGTCSGELTDRKGRRHRLRDAPARYEVNDAGGSLSCFGGTANGTGILRFGRSREIAFSLTERRPAPGIAIVSLTGAAGGTASVVGTVSPSEDILGLNERCNGAGVSVIHGDARIVSAALTG